MTFRGELMRKTKKRGQASIEFLTTYGWAMLAILLAIGVLYYFNFLDADRYVTTKCETGSQIQCVEAVYTGGQFKIKLRNNNPVELDIEVVVSGDRNGHLTHNNVPANSVQAFEIGVGGGGVEGEKYDLSLEINYGRTSTEYTVHGAAVVKYIS